MGVHGVKYKSDFNVLDMYRLYKNKCKDSGKEPVGLSDYRKLLKEFNSKICKYIVEESGEYRMPYRLGYLRIRKFKGRLKIDPDGKLITKHLQVDWVATKQLWEENAEAKADKKIIWHTNRHTDGYYFKWYWDKRACNITNSSVYSLVMTRANKRSIASTLKQNENLDYYE